MISLTVHALPPVFCYVIRWKTEWGVDYWGLVDSPDLSLEVMGEMLKWGSIFYWSWVAIYSVIMHIMFYNLIKKGEWRNSIKD